MQAYVSFLSYPQCTMTNVHLTTPRQLPHSTSPIKQSTALWLSPNVPPHLLEDAIKRGGLRLGVELTSGGPSHQQHVFAYTNDSIPAKAPDYLLQRCILPAPPAAEQRIMDALLGEGTRSNYAELKSTGCVISA